MALTDSAEKILDGPGKGWLTTWGFESSYCCELLVIEESVMVGVVKRLAGMYQSNE